MLHNMLRAAAGRGDYSDAVLADSPSGYWRLDELSGTTAFDETANGYNATYVGSPSLAQPPLITTGTSVSFDGVDDKATTSWPGVLGTSPLSAEAWISTSSTGDDCWLGWGNASGSGSKAVFRLDGGRPRFEVSSGFVVFDFIINDGTAHHVVFTHPGGGSSTDQAKCFVDGLEIATFASSHTNLNIQAGEDVAIGLDSRLPSFREFTGKIDEVAVYISELSPGRVQSHYDAGVGA